MSGLQRGATAVGGSGSLRVATNTPHLVSLGNDRLSTAVTLHPVNQGRVTIGSDPTCDVYVRGAGVCSVHCRLENSHGVVTLYPLNGATWLDARPVQAPTRLSQGSMVTLGRSSHLRFNHPQEARLMKAVLPADNEQAAYLPLHGEQDSDAAARPDANDTARALSDLDTARVLSELDTQLDMTLREMGRQKPPVAPRKPFKDLDSDSASNSDQESLKSNNSIRAKVSKFEYYAKQQKNVGRSQFYTTHDNELSPKVFSSNSLTVNTPAKDVLGGKDVPSNYAVVNQDCERNNVSRSGERKVMMSDNDNNVRNFSYSNVVLRQKTSKIEDMVKSFDVLADSFKTTFSAKSNNASQNNVHSNKPLKDLKENNLRAQNGTVSDRQEMSQTIHAYHNATSKFDVDVKDEFRDVSNAKSSPIEIGSVRERDEEGTYGRIKEVPRAKYVRPSPSYDREPSYAHAQSYSAPYNLDASAQLPPTHSAQGGEERLREQRAQAQAQAESARLEEILSMCAEYERQAACGVAATERRSHNKIITNGSLPRAHPAPSPLNSPSFLLAPDGHYKFDTSQNRLQNNLSKSLPARNVSAYENIDLQNHSYLELQRTPEVKLRNQSSYENVANVGEIGIPVSGAKEYNKIGIPIHDISANCLGIPTDSPTKNFPITELSSPIMIRKLSESRLGNGDVKISPISSPYENVMLAHGSYKPKSPTTQSPRTRIKTTFAHKKLPTPQYFVFPTPPPKEDDKTNLFDFGNEIGIPYSDTNNTGNERQDPNRSNYRLESIYENQAFEDDAKSNTSDVYSDSNTRYKIPVTNGANHSNLNTCSENEISHKDPVSNVEPKFDNSSHKEGIEKQLSLEEEIPMIDDSELTNDIECRSSQVLSDKNDDFTNLTKIVDIPIDGPPDEKIDDFEQCPKNKTNQENLNYSPDTVREIKDQSLNNVENNVASESLDFIYNNNNGADIEDYISTENDAEKTFDDLKKEIMADIPELERFEKDIKEPKRHDIAVESEREQKDNVISPKLETENIDAMRKRYEVLKESRKKLLLEMNELKRKMSDIRCQEDDILRELEMEKALIKGEYDSEIAILNIEQKKREELQEKLRRHEEEMKEMKRRQEDKQNDARERVEIASAKVESLERGGGEEGEGEQVQAARDILEHETRLYEDLEFTHLERESEMLAHREDIQNEISIITKRIESQKNRILNLKSEASCNLTSALDETRELHGTYVQLLNQVEDITTTVQHLEKELKPLVLRLKEHEANVQMANDAGKRQSDEFRYTPSDDSDVSLDVKMIDRSPLDQMSQSMMIDIERRDIKDLIDDTYRNGKTHDNDADANSKSSESPSKSSTKEKKGFWERNFDSLTRRRKEKKIPKQDLMSMSLNENFLYDNEIETECGLEKFNSLRIKKKSKDITKSNSSSKIPTFSLGKIIKKDSLKRKEEVNINDCRNIFVKNINKTPSDKYKTKAKSPDSSRQKDEESTIDPKSKIDPEETAKDPKKVDSDSPVKVLHRKSCGDEPTRVSSEFSKILSDSGKIPSQDDIDRISRVTSDAPILSSEAKTLGRRTLDSLKEIERKRMVMLEEQGCQVMEKEREKISVLKRAKQDEAMRLWVSERERDTQSPRPQDGGDQPRPQDGAGAGDVSAASAADDSGNCSNDAIFDESSGVLSSSIEELPQDGRADSGGGTCGSGGGSGGRGDTSRPLSDTSDLSHDNLLGGSWGRGGGGGRDGWCAGAQRPLTRYLPTDEDLNLREHLESAGHEVSLCPHVAVDATSCRGYLHKLGAKFHTWAKRWFVFDRVSKTFVYYWDKSEKKPRGGAYFQVIEEVYLDHGNASRSPQPLATVVVKTRARRYYLLCASNQAARIWIDAIFTGAHHYTHYRT